MDFIDWWKDLKIKMVNTYTQERYKSKKEADKRIDELLSMLIKCHMYHGHRDYVVQIWDTGFKNEHHSGSSNSSYPID